MYPVEGHPNMRVIPATSKLSEANQYLASLGMGARVLRMRLEPVADIFDVCLIDAPQQDSQLTLTTIGAADSLIMPAEANVKGYQALARALELYAEQKELGGTQAELCGTFGSCALSRCVGRLQPHQRLPKVDYCDDKLTGWK